MELRLSDLPWLPEPPEDFRQQVMSLARIDADSRALAQRFAGYRLSGHRLHTLGNAIARLATENANAIRLGILSNGSTDLLLPALSVGALRHGVLLRPIGTAFDQVAAEALNPTSKINQARCHFVLVCVDHRGLPLTPTPGDSDRARATVNAALLYIDSIRNALRGVSGCTVVIQTVPQVVGALFGSLERNVPGTLQWLIDQFNRELRVSVENSPDLLLDAAALAETVGLAQWHDSVQWALGKFPFAHAIVPLYSDWVGRLIAAARGKARKCLVLDLDNTLWGGVIGDDGLAGIVLGNGSPAGEAYLSIQQTALALRERGIVLAVSSKNDDQVARSVFRSHPEMLLKEEHIAVFQANWRDKATNLQAISDALNIGIDALVLLDDNPAEREQVRAALPAVAVPELPTDPTFYAQLLCAAGYFEATAFTSEDRRRAGQYEANVARTGLLGTMTNMDSYLRSLQMRAICGIFDRVGRARIAQLINKTNQFNLTTRRYTEAQVEAFERSRDGLTLQVRLVDRFGDNGMIAVVICISDGSDWVIDTWLMSCRVLNRMVEQATLNYVVGCAQLAGVGALIGQYMKTERNGMVEDHYARLGFARLFSNEAESRWRLDVASYSPVAVPIEIVETASVSASGGEQVIA
jgi:FkbH-like protein